MVLHKHIICEEVRGIKVKHTRFFRGEPQKNIKVTFCFCIINPVNYVIEISTLDRVKLRYCNNLFYIKGFLYPLSCLNQYVRDGGLICSRLAQINMTSSSRKYTLFSMSRYDKKWLVSALLIQLFLISAFFR